MSALQKDSLVSTKARVQKGGFKCFAMVVNNLIKIGHRKTNLLL